MRWEYKDPEQKLFVSDGVKIYSYVPQDKQVIVSTVNGDDVSTSAMFLAGRGNLMRDFTPSLVDLPAGLPAGSRALKLTPKSRGNDYDWLILAVDPAIDDIETLVAEPDRLLEEVSFNQVRRFLMYRDINAIILDVRLEKRLEGSRPAADV